MRFIYLNTISCDEKRERIKFLSEVFHLYFIDVDGSKLNEFASIPYDAYDCLILYGHNNLVNLYINNHHIAEKRIVLITCIKNLAIPHFLKNKKVYISKADDKFTNFYDGNVYGFNFDVTDSEILLYRFRNRPFYEQINASFERLVI